MTSKIILEGIKDATRSINNNTDFLIAHATDQLHYLDEVINKMAVGCVVLVEETYSNILLLGFETDLINKAIKYNKPAIKISNLELEIIETNCDDLLTKIKQIKEMQENRVPHISKKDFQRVINNESDIDFGAV